jgi:ankyrin repeat protein
MLRMLLKQGADVHSRSSLREGRNIYYLTLIAYASTKGHAPVVRLLLERGANPNDANAGLYTPVFLATQAGHVDAVKLLLDRGANKNTPVNGKTPLQVARSGLDNAPAQYKPAWQEMVRLLSR